jgi:hypothetical protein
MDCQTARLLLPYLNPRAESLPTEIAHTLEAHVAGCERCTQQLQQTGREDRIVAQAMRDVEVPDGVQQRLLVRLRRERIRRRRNWPVRHPRWAAAAALFFCLIAGASVYWWQRPLPIIDVNALEYVSQFAGSPQQVEMLFAERGIRKQPPTLFRYNYLVTCGWELLQNKVVPRLLFEGNNGQLAEVYILSDSQFDLAKSPPGTGNILFRSDPFDPEALYMVRYSGGAPDWLFNASAPGI